MKIKRKLSKNEITIMRLSGILNGVTQYLKEKGLFEDCQAWFRIKLGGGDDTNGLQGNRKEGCKDADEGKDVGCGCSEGSCCKEGKEEVGIKAVDYRCSHCDYNSIDNPGSISISKEGKFFCPCCGNPLAITEARWEGVG